MPDAWMARLSDCVVVKAETTASTTPADSDGNIPIAVEMESVRAAESEPVSPVVRLARMAVMSVVEKSNDSWG